MAILYSQAERVSYDRASRGFVSKHIEALAMMTHLAPEEHREEHASAMRDAASIIEVRNGVIHGLGWPDVGETVWRTQRPNRAVKPDVEHDWLVVDYDRELLIGVGRRAHEVGGFIQTQAARWPGFMHDTNSGCS